MADTSLDRFGRFNDHQLQEEFLLYCLDQRSKFTLTIITFIILTWSVFETLMIRNDDNPTVELIYCTTSLLLSFVGFILCSILIFSPFKSKNRFFYSNCQALLLVCLNLLFMIKAIKKIHIGTYLCLPEAYNSKKLVLKYLSPDVSDVDVETFQRILGYVHLPVACPPDNSYYSLANRTAITIMVMTFQILTAVIYEPRIYLVWSCYLPTVGLVLFMDFYTFFSLIPLVVGFIVIALLLGELHYQRVQSFLNQKKIKQLLDENERNADASHAMEMRHMISNVAHDLKTPLASFTNGLDIIKEILVSTSKKMSGENSSQSDSEIFAETCASIQTCLANIRNTNAFMLMTINRCLDYTKASKGMKLIPKYETVDLREALQFPIECMSNIQERIGIKLEALSEEICTHIITDKQWLQENLLCLLSNAVKYSTEGNVTITATLKRTMSKPTIQLTQTISSLFGKQSSNNTNKIVPTVSIDDSEYEVEEYYLLFEIEDTGIGLSEEASKNLFNPFKQAQRLAGGTGLGLYSLAKRMEALKGDYGVRRRKDLNKGSLFWFTLPYKPDPVSAASKDNLLLDQPLYTKNEQSVSFNSPNTNGDDVLKILLVDDAPSILKMSSMMLKRQGHQIWTAENGEIALKKIEEKWKNTGKGFDLVLMDLQMPVMDGLEATRRLRQMEEEGREWMKPRDNSSKRVITTPNNTILCHQIIIGLSANSDHETAVEAFNAGVDDFFGKPFSLTTFNKTIERFFH